MLMSPGGSPKGYKSKENIVSLKVSFFTPIHLRNAKPKIACGGSKLRKKLKIIIPLLSHMLLMSVNTV